jgi:hypothetical protein
MPAKSKQPPTSMYLEAGITILFDRNATVALVSTYVDDELIEATGSAKREQYDVSNTEIAVNLALGRAFVKLGRQMQSEGHKLVKQATK